MVLDLDCMYANNQGYVPSEEENRSSLNKFVHQWTWTLLKPRHQGHLSNICSIWQKYLIDRNLCIIICCFPILIKIELIIIKNKKFIDMNSIPKISSSILTKKEMAPNFTCQSNPLNFVIGHSKKANVSL